MESDTAWKLSIAVSAKSSLPLLSAGAAEGNTKTSRSAVRAKPQTLENLVERSDGMGLHSGGADRATVDTNTENRGIQELFDSSGMP